MKNIRVDYSWTISVFADVMGPLLYLCQWIRSLLISICALKFLQFEGHLVLNIFQRLGAVPLDPCCWDCLLPDLLKILCMLESGASCKWKFFSPCYSYNNNDQMEVLDLSYHFTATSILHFWFVLNFAVLPPKAPPQCTIFDIKKFTLYNHNCIIIEMCKRV